MKHTAGPWYVCMDSRGCPSVREKGGFVAFTPSVQHYGDPERYFNEKEEAEANARLISAAPDMLELLKKMQAATLDIQLAFLLQDADKLIARAEGRA